MLRFVACLWDADAVGQKCTARAIVNRLMCSGLRRWRTIVNLDGLLVVCGGTDPSQQAIQHWTLADGRGVVLGTLFTRSAVGMSHSRKLTFARDESRRVVSSEGRDLVENYWGRYVAFLRDPAHGTKWIVRDPTGDIECLTIAWQDVTVCFSSLRDFPLLDTVKFSINWDYVAASINFSMPDTEMTGLNEITRVLAGESVRIERGSFSRRFCWNPAEIARSHVIEDQAYAEKELERTTKRCVNSWAASYRNVLLKLSGGLDSSILLACLVDAPARPRITCANFFSSSDPNSDERRFARLAAARAERPLLEAEPDWDFNAASLLPLPPYHSPVDFLSVSAWNAPARALARELGVSAAFTGGGGDELFFVAGSTYACSDDIFRHGLRAESFRLALNTARLRKLSVWRTLADGVRDGLIRRPSQTITAAYTASGLVMPDVAESVLQRQLFLHPWVGHSQGLPAGKLMHILNLSHAYGMNAAEPFSADDDPDDVHPLFSQPLKELCLRMPTTVLAPAGWSRAVARRAFANHVPHEILWRREKCGPNAYIKRLVTRNSQIMTPTLLDGSLVKQGIVDRHKLEVALGGLSKGFGTAPQLCALFSTEAWLNSWSEKRADHAAA